MKLIMGLASRLLVFPKGILPRNFATLQNEASFVLGLLLNLKPTIP